VYFVNYFIIPPLFHCCLRQIRWGSLCNQSGLRVRVFVCQLDYCNTLYFSNRPIH